MASTSGCQTDAIGVAATPPTQDAMQVGDAPPPTDAPTDAPPVEDEMQVTEAPSSTEAPPMQEAMQVSEASSPADAPPVPDVVRATDALPTVHNTVDHGVVCSEPIESEYRMDREFQGLCLIFNMSHFHARMGLKPEDMRRRCFDDKAKKITKTFQSMGFKCETFKDLRLEQVNEKIQEYRGKKEELSKSNCFVCWYLTCRTEDSVGTKIYAYDKQIRLKDVTEPFTGDNCPELVGKPKLFFVEADYMKKYEENVLADCRSGWRRRTAYKIPVSADVLLGTCMTPKRKYCFDMQYAEVFCKVFDEHCTTEPVNEITVLLDRVAKQVQEKAMSSSDKYQTTSSYISTLTKNFYLTKVPEKKPEPVIIPEPRRTTSRRDEMLDEEMEYDMFRRRFPPDYPLYYYDEPRIRQFMKRRMRDGGLFNRPRDDILLKLRRLTEEELHCMDHLTEAPRQRFGPREAEFLVALRQMHDRKTRLIDELCRERLPAEVLRQEPRETSSFMGGFLRLLNR